MPFAMAAASMADRLLCVPIRLTGVCSESSTCGPVACSHPRVPICPCSSCASICLHHKQVSSLWLGMNAAGGSKTQLHEAIQNARLGVMHSTGKVDEGTQAQGSILSMALSGGCPVGRELPSSEASRARSWSTQHIALVAALSASASCSVFSLI